MSGLVANQNYWLSQQAAKAQIPLPKLSSKFALYIAFLLLLSFILLSLLLSLFVVVVVAITKTCPCNKQRILGLKLENFSAENLDFFFLFLLKT